MHKKGFTLRKFLSIFLTVLLLALFAVFGFKGKEIYSMFSNDVEFLKTSCDLSQNSCAVTFDDNRSITLEIDRLKANANMLFSVMANGFNDDTFKARIYGVNMNMGIFEFELPKKSNGIYEGDVLLPSCVSGEMTWDIEIISSENKLGGIFTIVI